MAAAKPKSKIFTKSVTIWGAIITAVTAVVPAVTTLFGFDVSPADIMALGEAGTKIINGIGSFVGLVMVIYGRLRDGQGLKLTAS